MDKHAAFSWALFLLLVGAFFYPPLASLLGDALRALVGLGAAGGLFYLALRHPWRAAEWATGAGALVFASVVTHKVAPLLASSQLTLLCWLVLLFVTVFLLRPFYDWLDKKGREFGKSR